MKPTFTLILACLLMISCGGHKQQSQTKAPKPFTMPSIPAMITNPVERANYLVVHYWDSFDFADTMLIGNKEITEQAFSDYLNVLPHATPQSMISSIRRTIDKTLVSHQMFAHFVDLFEKYLYDPNSPMRNEELYLLILEGILASPQVDDVDKIRPQFQLEQVNRNRVGNVAVDFTYTLANGKQGSMYKIKAEYLILYFNNPGCGACSEYQQGLEQSAVVKQLVEAGRLKVLAMYVDEELEAWERNRPTIPPSWINGYDSSFAIRGKNLYDLRAIPNLYLLDREKKVLLKDVTPYQIEEALLNNIQNAR